MDKVGQKELLAACRVLFDREFEASFLRQLQETGLQSAWRRKALQTHPDRVVPDAAKRAHTERFIEARRAYGLLLEHVARRPRRGGSAGAPAPTASQPRPRPSRPSPRAPRPAAGWQGKGRPEAGVPRRSLRLGEYLYHSRQIPFEALIAALVWQRLQRDRFCDVCRRWRLLTDADVARLLAERSALERVGEVAERMRLLTAFQVRTVLAFQRSRQRPIGVYFVEKGLLTPARLEGLLERCRRHNAAFGRAR
jgi:hypothetical protein